MPTQTQTHSHLASGRHIGFFHENVFLAIWGLVVFLPWTTTTRTLLDWTLTVTLIPTLRPTSTLALFRQRPYRTSEAPLKLSHVYYKLITIYPPTPQKNYISIVLNFSRDNCNSQEELKTKGMHFLGGGGVEGEGNKMYYGRCASGLSRINWSA